MKIGYLAENYFPTLGGVQEHIYHLARQMIQKGHQVRVLTGLPNVDVWRGPPDEEWVRRVGRARRYSVMGSRTTFTFGPAVLRRLRQVLREERFDLIHVHAPCDVGLPMLLYPSYHGPIVATLHSPMNNPSPLRWLAAPYYGHVLRRRCAAVISVSEAARAAMGRYARFESQILPNGVDTAALTGGKPIARFRDGKINVLMLGRLEPRNGPDIMFQALPRVLARHPNLRLLVAGAGKNGTAEHEAMVPAELRDKVVFLGAVYEERADVYATADVVVLPARSGSFSIIILEALAAGRPVVATPFVKGWQTERHFGPVKVAADITSDAVADALSEMLAEDPSPRIAAGRVIAREFDWAEVANRVLAVYEQVLVRRRTQPRRR